MQARQGFHFSKNHRDLKKEYIFLKFAETFLLHQRTIDKQKIKIKFVIVIFFNGENGFDLKNSKQIK